MPNCRWCFAREEENHIDDCGVWCGEHCTCLARFDPDEIYDRMRDRELEEK
jgi:hypothetical protein